MDFLKCILVTTNSVDLKEWGDFVATITESKDQELFLSTLSVCMSKSDESEFDDLINAIEPLFIAFNPKLSYILSISHTLCGNCELYVPGHVSLWVENNPELFSVEIPFFVDLLQRFGQNIIIDVDSYSEDEAITPTTDIERISTQSEYEILKQLYTIIKYYDDFE